MHESISLVHAGTTVNKFHNTNLIYITTGASAGLFLILTTLFILLCFIMLKKNHESRALQKDAAIKQPSPIYETIPDHTELKTESLKITSNEAYAKIN